MAIIITAIKHPLIVEFIESLTFFNGYYDSAIKHPNDKIFLLEAVAELVILFGRTFIIFERGRKLKKKI